MTFKLQNQRESSPA